jgi:hypothetical protein
MRGVSNVITVVMAVILAASIMVLAFNILGSAREGIEDIEGTSKTQQQRLAGVQSLSKACQDWMFGDKYLAEAILNTYDLPNKMRPYEDVKRACGDNLESLARECFNTEEGYRDCAGNGYISASAPVVLDCTKTCSRIIDIFDTCEASCPKKAGICFEYILENYVGRSDLTGSSELSLRDTWVARACEG